jgi:FtsZ-interacting cell division protein ZipA
MTELQMGLIGLGTAAVVGVVAYNKWQERQHRKLAQKMLNAQHEDVLLDEAANAPSADAFVENEAEAFAVSPERANLPAHAVGERIEPMLRLDPRLEEPVLPRDEPLEPLTRQFAASAEPVVAAVPQSVEPEPMPVPARSADDAKEARDSVQPFHLLSPVIDYVASFEAVEPAPAYQILESQRDVLARVRKPVHWIGYNERSREWEPIVDDGDSEYRRIRIGLQLVDRHGPARDSDLSTFHIAMQDLSDELMAIVELPPRQPALEAAAQLDEFCAGVDIQIGINVISQGQVFPGTKLRALAEAAGMAIDTEGRFVRRDDDGNVLYLLTNHESAGFSVESMKTMSTHGVTFLLDVPRVSHGDRVFNQMLDLARRFAEALHGSLVDDNRRPLSEGALEPIRRQVAQYQAAMAARSLPAGGPLALRLFS